MVFQHVVIGTQDGVAIVVDFPCSDVCPGQTRRIIHLDITAEEGRLYRGRGCRSEPHDADGHRRGAAAILCAAGLRRG